MPGTMGDILAAGHGQSGAIGAPGRPFLGYAGLRRLAETTTAALNGAGIGRDDRVAIVLPNGPEMAASFVSHRLRRDDRAAQSGLSRPRSSSSTSPISSPRRWSSQRGHGDPGARRSRGKLGVPIVRARSPQRPGRPAASRCASTDCPPRAPGRRPGAGPTTSPSCCTPRAPRRGRRSCRSARQSSPPRRAISARRSRSTPSDLCLNIMPLFHIHGLIGGALCRRSPRAPR